MRLNFAQKPPSGALRRNDLEHIHETLECLVPTGQDFSIETWARRLETFLYKRIRFVETSLPIGFHGARIVLLPDSEQAEQCPTEIVITSTNLLPLMREHTRAHELAHIALGHATMTLTPQQLLELKGDISIICRWPGATCRAVEPERLTPSILRRDVMAETLARLAEKRCMEARARASTKGFSSDAQWERLINSIVGK